MKKSILKSKTFWFSVATALAPLYPPAAKWLGENAVQVGLLWGSVSAVLRWVTKDKVVLVD